MQRTSNQPKVRSSNSAKHTSFKVCNGKSTTSHISLNRYWISSINYWSCSHFSQILRNLAKCVLNLDSTFKRSATYMSQWYLFWYFRFTNWWTPMEKRRYMYGAWNLSLRSFYKLIKKKHKSCTSWKNSTSILGSLLISVCNNLRKTSPNRKTYK